MHIPDGFLNLPVLISTDIISAGILYPSLKKLNKESDEKRIPLMGISAAFVFTAQMLSFPLIGGTSVHISGTVLIAALLGPLTSIIITTAAILLQSILFQHGGLLTMGANILNIAIIQVIIGYSIFILFKKNPTGFFLGVFFSKITAAAFCACELILSKTIPLKAGLIAMLSSHAVAGIIEGIILLSVYKIIIKIKPNILNYKKI